MSAPFYFARPTDQVSAMDFSHLDRLRRGVQDVTQQDPEALREIAQQFESLFIQQMLKQARQSNPGLEGVFDSQQTRLAQSLSDEQSAQQLAKSGMGLAEALLQQMRGDTPQQLDPRLAADRGMAWQADVAIEATPLKNTKVDSISQLLEMLGNTAVGKQIKSTSEALYTAIKGAPPHIDGFVAEMGDAARKAAEQSGIPAKLILSQAALESGWGRREIRGEDGSNSYNLFGIKATSSWKGKVVNVMTTEYVNGEPKKMVQPFRAYDSYAESFADYARLISKTERYSEVMTAPNAEAAAVRIQKAGYATDPAYADKLISIMGYFDDRLGSPGATTPRTTLNVAQR